MKRSWIRLVLVAPLLALSLVTVWGGISVTPAYAWSIHAECDENGRVVGEIGVPVAGSFYIFVTDHIPGQGYWVEIPGSRQKITVVVGKEGGMVSFGPLDISNAREGINSIRVEQTETPEKSDSFKPCSKSPTPTATSTATATATRTSTATVTATNTLTSTPTKVPPSQTPQTATNTAVPTSTSVPPTATSTRAIVTTSTVAVPTTTRTPVIQLPPTGDGGDLGQYNGMSTTQLKFFGTSAVVLVIILGVLLAVTCVKVRPN